MPFPAHISSQRPAPQAAIDRVLGIRLTMFVPDISTWLESQGLVNRDVLKFRHGLLPQLMPICEATRDNPEEKNGGSTRRSPLGGPSGPRPTTCSRCSSNASSAGRTATRPSGPTARGRPE